MAKGSVSRSEVLLMAAIAVLIPAVILIGALIFAAFFAHGYSLLQKIVVIVVALILVVVAEMLLWMLWAASKGVMFWHHRK